jgi:AsmA protein
MKKLWIRVAAAAAALVLVVLVLIPFMVNAETFRPALEEQLTSALGRKVSLGPLSFSLISGSLKAKNISIADDPAFGSTPFLQAKQLSIRVETVALLFHRQVRVTELTIDSPAIQLIQTKAGAWNFSSLGGTSAGVAALPTSGIPDLAVSELKIQDGVATVSSLPARGKPFVYSGIGLAVQHLSLTESFPFQLLATLPDKGTLELKGNAGPLAANDAADTPFSANLQLKHFDPVAAGAIEAGQRVSMIVDLNAQAASDGKTLTSSGKIQADRLHLARTGAPATKPVDISYEVSMSLATRAGQISELAVHAGQVAAHAKGTFEVTGEAILVDLQISAASLPIDQLEQLLPAVGVTLPKGSSLQGGTLTANLVVKGPATDPVIAGPFEVDGTKLAGFDIGTRMEGMDPFRGSGGGTEIRTLRADLTSSPETTRFANIYADLPQVGTATGEGSVSSSEALDFQLLAKFNPDTGIGAVAGKAVNAVSGLARMFVKSKTNGAIPVTVAGTASDPKIHVKVGAMF